MSLDQRMLRLATRVALRAAGHVEPNPLVGCVIGIRESNQGARILGIGHHQRFGGPHAEANALQNAIQRGHADRLPGSTAWVTLEPCNHTGKTPPCATALINAGIAEVVIARHDPHTVAAGGAQTLQNAGIRVVFTKDCPAATRLSDPFIAWATRTPRRPWLIAKWAQTLDGKAATASGSSQWITGPTARRRVHALRARVDAIITGLGTVLKDDPLLTARTVPVRRVAQRVILDPQCQTPTTAKLIATARATPTVILCAPAAAETEHARSLRRAGCTILPCRTEPSGDRRLDLPSAMALLSEELGIHTALLEAGPELLSAAFRDQLIDEAWAFVAPKVLGDAQAATFAAWRSADAIADATQLHTIATRRCAQDTLIIMRQPHAP